MNTKDGFIRFIIELLGIEDGGWRGKYKRELEIEDKNNLSYKLFSVEKSLGFLKIGK